MIGNLLSSFSSEFSQEFFIFTLTSRSTLSTYNQLPTIKKLWQALHLHPHLRVRRKKEMKSQHFFVPPQLLEEYHARFIDEGYDNLSRLKNLELVDLTDHIGMRRGHACQLLREIGSLVILQQYPAAPVLAPNLEPSIHDMTTDASHPPTEFNHNQWCTVRQGVMTPYVLRKGGYFVKKFDNNFFSVWEH